MSEINLSHHVEHGISVIAETEQKIATNPSAGRKVIQIFIKIFAGVDWYQGSGDQNRPIVEVLKGANSILGFRATFKNIMFWINPFSKESLDQKALLNSLTSSLSLPQNQTKQIVSDKTDQVAKEILVDVALINFHSKKEVLEGVKKSLANRKISSEREFTDEQIVNITSKLIIQKKARSVPLILSTAFLTIAEAGSNVVALQKWHLLDLSKVAAKYGTSRVFVFVAKVGVDATISGIASIGLLVNTCDASHRLTKNAWIYFHAKSQKEKDEVYLLLRNALLDLFSNGTELVATASPLIFALNPPVIIGLAIVAKGTGLICILIR